MGLRSPAASMGTAPVFLTSITTILGAIMYLRFGYSVSQVGLLGTWAIVLLGHLATIPTALAVAEIATNRRVEGGGAYYIISRSFGITIGASIGTALYLSQAISTAFYLIAFAQGFGPIFAAVNEWTGLSISDPRIVSVPGLIALSVLMVTRGAKAGTVFLYIIAAIIAASLLVLFYSKAEFTPSSLFPQETVKQPDSFFHVFAIIFPGFTGIMAGVGLSGDLKNPSRSIPLGTLAATAVGFIVYMAIPYKLAVSASPEELAADQLIMVRIASWGPLVLAGLAAATISSALGSIMVAPRTLQALAKDRVFISDRATEYLSRTNPHNNEPVNASVVTFGIALVFVLIGDVDFVAEIISMFFMVTYGSLCLISFLEHFAANPSYRPTFRSRWYISLPGALVCFWLMFQMRPMYAALALILLVGSYVIISHYNPDQGGLSEIFRGVMFQIARKLQVFLQKAGGEQQAQSWRPAVVSLSKRSFERFDAFDMLRWLSYRYGFGTYIHLIEGYLSRASRERAELDHRRLIRLADISASNVFVETLVSPSYTTAVAQVLQLPGVSGKPNNTILFEFPKQSPEGLKDIVDNYPLIQASDFDTLILGSSPRKFGFRKEIHIWVTNSDYENANLMLLLAYIVLGHPDWEHGLIRIFDVLPLDHLEAGRSKLQQVVQSGRLPIAPHHVQIVPRDPETPVKAIINEQSCDADLVVLGFRGELLRKDKTGFEFFQGYDRVGNVLFVNTREIREIG